MRNEKKAMKLKGPNWFQKHLPSFHNVSLAVSGGRKLGKSKDSFLGSQGRKWDFDLVSLVLYLHSCLLPYPGQICAPNPHPRKEDAVIANIAGAAPSTPIIECHPPPSGLDRHIYISAKTALYACVNYVYQAGGFVCVLLLILHSTPYIEISPWVGI